jgi:hypothetical protein
MLPTAPIQARPSTASVNTIRRLLQVAQMKYKFFFNQKIRESRTSFRQQFLKNDSCFQNGNGVVAMAGGALGLNDESIRRD